MSTAKTSFFYQPYPLFKSWRIQILRIALVSGFVALFLIIFQPFGTENVQMPYKNLFLAGYGAISFFSFLFAHTLLPFFFPRYFNEVNWTVGKQILFLAIPLSFTFIFSYVYLLWGINASGSWRGGVIFCFIVLSIAFVPVTVVTLVDYLLKFKVNSERAQALNQQLAYANEVTARSPTEITLVGENCQIKLRCSIDDFCFAKAADNYVEIYYRQNGKLQRTLMRSSLTNIERQLKDFPIRRCHRSYLVQINQIEHITGNAQAYQLHLKSPVDTPIPLSRQRAKTLLAELPNNFN